MASVNEMAYKLMNVLIPTAMVSVARERLNFVFVVIYTALSSLSTLKEKVETGYTFI